MISNCVALKKQIAQTDCYIFDLDGTLVHLEQLHLKAFGDVLMKHFRLPLSNDDYQTYISGRGSRPGLTAFLVSKGVAEFDAVQLQQEFFDIKRKYLNDNLSEDIFVSPGCVNFIQKLRLRKKKVALATSTGPGFAQLLLQKARLPAFDVVVTFADVSHTKPSPEIYMLTLSRLDCQAENAIVFEDSVNGIASAQTAGLFCVAIRNPGQNEKFIGKADATIDSFEEVVSLV